MIQQMGSSVIALDVIPALAVDRGEEVLMRIGGQLIHQKHRQVILLDRIEDLDPLPILLADESTCVAHLAAHLSVEGRCFKDHLIALLPILRHLAIPDDPSLRLVHLIADEGGLCLPVTDPLPVAGLGVLSLTGALFLLRHLAVEALQVRLHTLLLED